MDLKQCSDEELIVRYRDGDTDAMDFIFERYKHLVRKKAKAMLPKEIQDDQSFYPSDETLDHLEVYQQLGKKLLGVYNDLYLQVKMYRK